MPLAQDSLTSTTQMPNATQGLASFTNGTTIVSNSTVQGKAELLLDNAQNKIQTLANNQNIKATTDDKNQYTFGQRPDMVNYKTPEELQYELGSALTHQVLTRTDGSKYMFRRNADDSYAHDANGNWIEDPYNGQVRNAYIDNTIEGNMKFGLASSSVKPGYTPFEARYMDKTHTDPYTYTKPYMEDGKIVYNADGTQKVGYDGTPGPRGVTNKNGALMDVMLPYNVATELEYDIHTNAGQIASRAMGQGPKTPITEAQFGAGQTEYTTPDAPLWNQNYDMSKAKIADNTILPHEVTLTNSGRYTADELNKLLGVSSDTTPSNNTLRGVGAASLDVGAKVGSLIGRGVEGVGQLLGNETTKGVGKTIQDAYTKFQMDNVGKEMTGYDDRNAQAL